MARRKGKKSRIKWTEMDQSILDAIDGLESHGFSEPTIRSVYYVLGTLNTIPLTDSGYKSLDKKMVEMRIEEKIPWGFFAVKRGTSIEAGVKVNLPHNCQVTVPFVFPDDWAEHFIIQLKDAAGNFQLPRWYNQKNLVEVWVEKDGLLGATSNWTEDLDVTVRAPQGYGAWEFIHDAMQKIKRELKQQSKKATRIIYLGDLDPSGKDIPRFMSEEAIEHFKEKLGISEFTFSEIALTPEQVRKHNLPQMPESEEVMEKISRDPRLKWYKENYPPDMFVELDAFYALATDAVKNLIRDKVSSYFDDNIYNETRKEEQRSRKRIRRMIEERVTFMNGLE